MRQSGNQQTLFGIKPADKNIIPTKIVQNTPLIHSCNILLPHLHTGLGMMQQFIKLLGKRNIRGFEYIAEKVPQITQAKLKEGLFVGPSSQRKAMRCRLQEILDKLELPIQNTFNCVCENLLGNKKALDCKGGIKALWKCYSANGSHVSLRVHFLDSHQDFFADNHRVVFDERGKKIPQVINAMEKRYQGFWNQSLLAD